jgi:hypothetical protein
MSRELIEHPYNALDRCDGEGMGACYARVSSFLSIRDPPQVLVSSYSIVTALLVPSNISKGSSENFSATTSK